MILNVFCHYWGYPRRNQRISLKKSLKINLRINPKINQRINQKIDLKKNPRINLKINPRINLPTTMKNMKDTMTDSAFLVEYC